MKINELTKNQVMEQADIRPSTLGLYIKKRLVPYPRVVSNYQGKQGRTSLFDAQVVERIKKIKKFLSEGFTLEAIKNKLDAEETNSDERANVQKVILKDINEVLKSGNELTKENIDHITHGIHMGWGTAIPDEKSGQLEFFKSVTKMIKEQQKIKRQNR